MEMKGKPVLEFASQPAWERWLDENHATSDGVWVMFAKKGSGITTVNYAEAVESALCFGWIDSQMAAFDERYYLQKFTPRRAKSPWSQINREKVERLIAAGRMRSAGLREVALARADGRWQAANPPPSALYIQDDLQQAFDANPAAAAFYQTLDRANRYAIFYRIQNAPNPHKRAELIQKLVAMLVSGKKPHP